MTITKIQYKALAGILQKECRTDMKQLVSFVKYSTNVSEDPHSETDCQQAIQDIQDLGLTTVIDGELMMNEKGRKAFDDWRAANIKTDGGKLFAGIF